MESYHIRGGNPISGEYTVNGAKNAALPILAASIVTKDENLFTGCPRISDVAIMGEILRSLGCRTEEKGSCILVDTAGVNEYEVPTDLMEKMRSSIFLVGPLLTRCGKAVISQPGGCAIGKRPIDIHIKALSQLGVTIEETGQRLVFTGGRMSGTNIILDFPSVGATENVMMAALGAKGETVIHNSAREPEIMDLQDYLNGCGARIKGAGTSQITIKGGLPLHGSDHRIMGDRIEAGTFLMAAAGTGGELLVKGVESDALRSLLRHLKHAGCKVKRHPKEIWIQGPGRLRSVGRLQTGPYPDFATDLQPQFTAIMATAAGRSRIEETIFENRFKYAGQLIKMGADIEILQRTAIIEGVEFLEGSRVAAEDLRGGAALVLAGLMACGETIVNDVHYIERGYCDFHGELKKLGGDIGKSYERT
ncbi:UDP-N-acetylglucosamine 1-carboxyvinyltransferase [Anaerovorax odorimutans]|uniref:UDP-N-acetylglucosamine 1-carboxyvinyltransferase n=1 Tax=Anaerovorax odorimutans TaxID=109327 RepID=A0ABT1RPS3_9FIRM|nr:UDP-N-acetylglucosamine 1-carboxyvinyltransferase [Anaerovorax odorimutans]MCQ4637192.1 UDP-N-acetylglucosamine 1-carboxyvinyltransferase [Anaerovorax odorimutans]